MKGDAKVIEYLNSGLRSELTAVSQYWLHYRLQEDWGLGKLAAKSRAESIEEMQHADKFIARIIFLEGHPNLQKLDPLRIGQTARETLECDLAAEYGARALYAEARERYIGRSTGCYQVDVTNQNGDLIATFESSVFRKDQKVPFTL